MWGSPFLYIEGGPWAFGSKCKSWLVELGLFITERPKNTARSVPAQCSRTKEFDPCTGTCRTSSNQLWSPHEVAKSKAYCQGLRTITI